MDFETARFNMVEQADPSVGGAGSGRFGCVFAGTPGDFCPRGIPEI